MNLRLNSLFFISFHILILVKLMFFKDIHFRIKEVSDIKFATFLELLSHVNISRSELSVIKKVFVNVKSNTSNLAKDYMLTCKYLDEIKRRFGLAI